MTRPLRSLRLLMALCLFTGLALTSAACAKEPPPTVSVLGPWTGDEAESFETVLEQFTGKYGIEVDYQGTTSLRETLLAQMQAGSPPDIAVLNSLGELTEYAHNRVLVPLPEQVRERSPEPWAPELIIRGRKNTYWTPIKVDLKSVVWHYPGRPAQQGAWCIGVGSGATTGWPGSDWIEDILLQKSGPAVYEQWATGELAWGSGEVREAWKTWGRLIGSRADAALRSDFEGNDGKGLLKRTGGGCGREHQGSFVRRLYGKDIAYAPTTKAVAELDNNRGAYEVAGDMAAMFRDTAGARALITFLTGDEARATWARAVPERNRPFFPVSVGSYGDAWANRAVNETLTGARRLCADASDVMPAGVRGAFYRAVLEFLAAPEDEELLTGLLRQLDDETARHRELGTPRVPSVCAAPPGG
ncbi:extracellular solute-binding protein [Streptomyces sp. ISL-96]|uniref:extracellular solute-binding protein n=1 Tax=Streptomyces sp. ISL-96 TaxID=2819191 RepID=UPI001BE9C6C2|nr:extracellular solute-binding protein [Streptomyces sp. ISL-96]MBT2489096.1 extracellular solute-binding protein [Streptomyces sp. ISL-96]